MILFLSAAFPVVILLYLIYKKDTEREPIKLLLKSFGLGCLVTLPVVLIEMLLMTWAPSRPPLVSASYHAFVVAALVEEGFKFLVLYGLIWRSKAFDQYFDGIVYAVFVSLGFAFVENVLYVVDGGFGTSLVRAVLAVPAHGLFGVIMGYFFSLARFTSHRHRVKWFLRYAFLLPLFFHGMYDFVLFYGEQKSENTILVLFLYVLFAVVVVALWRTGLKQIKRHLEKDVLDNENE
ncbi:MAG: hypothetical protein CSA95_00050 [Bacteroidetes bacterium]|nr:MAG: hypothetical protein CSA95_00050 [Bacteroidota bacterium]